MYTVVGAAAGEIDRYYDVRYVFRSQIGREICLEVAPRTLSHSCQAKKCVGRSISECGGSVNGETGGAGLYLDSPFSVGVLRAACGSAHLSHH